MRMAKTLVTGGGGFIGSHLVRALLTGGHDVRILDNFSTGHLRNLSSVLGEVELLEGDLRSLERVQAAARGCELVFHQGALPSVPRSIEDPLTSAAVNSAGTLNVLLAARDAEVRRVIYASSSSVYGAGSGEVKSESALLQPLSPYAVAKQAGESFCRSFTSVYDLETVALRYFNVFGPYQSPVSQYAAVIPNFITAALLEEPALIYGDGEQCRDFTYVDNVVAANLAASSTEGIAGEIFNIAVGARTAVNDLIDAIGQISGRDIEVRHLPDRVGEIKVSQADVSKAQAVLNYEPTVDLLSGLRETYAHFQEDPTVIERVREFRHWSTIQNAMGTSR
jgi:UDP-glucose 4-epimerase